MKSAYAWLVCSLVASTCIVVSCSSDDDDNLLPAAGSSTGGVGGSTTTSGGTTTGGSGGSTATAGSGGTSGGSTPTAGTGGTQVAAGGESSFPKPICFGDDAGGAGGVGTEGGAAQGGAAQGGAEQGGASPSQGPWSFSCGHLTGYFDPAASKVVLDLPPELKATAGGRALVRVDDDCRESTITNLNSTLEIPVSGDIKPTSKILITTLEVHDACNGSIKLDTTPVSTEDCLGLTFIAPQDTNDWLLACGPASGAACAATCP